MRIVVGGFLGLLPAGGITWDYIQYPIGLAALGHEVYYIEDTRLWPVYQTNNLKGADCRANVSHVALVMDFFGLSRSWAYRDEASGQCFGMPNSSVRDIVATADVLLNVSCATSLTDEYHRIPARVLIDSDPMFTQIQYEVQEGFTPGKSAMREVIQGHTHHFTFGENVGAPDCRIPACGVTWRPTRQPICLGHWFPTPPPSTTRSSYTTVMNWAAARSLDYDGESWGQKDVEFRRFMSLPARVPELSLAVATGQTTGAAFPASEATRHGWRVLDPEIVVPDWISYRDFISQSCGEFSVAKETYVKARTGWFSCRSACYLASGRPVVTQDTGWSRYLPTGQGLLAFVDEDDAVDALEQIAADPHKHGMAARGVAEEAFASERVLSVLLDQVGC